MDARVKFLVECQRHSFRRLAADNLRSARKWKHDVDMKAWHEGKAAAYKLSAQAITDLLNTLGM